MEAPEYLHPPGPRVIAVGPYVYEARPLRVWTRREDGLPEEVQIVHPGDHIELSPEEGEDVFCWGYILVGVRVPPGSMKPKESDGEE